MNTSIHPTRQALRVHRSHLATTHRAPLVARHGASAGRATAFTPMAPYAPTDVPGDPVHHRED
ncbi:MAG: hypothetical protein JWP82_475 [Humibacillus sp.]|nr:hypothetical protein [Humibacillus sp.]